jgi:hypothetical protein
VPRLAPLVVLCALAGPARAEFKEWVITVMPAYAVGYVDQRTAHGGGPAVQVGFGVSDSLSIHVEGIVSFHGADKTEKFAAGELAGYGAFAGVTYMIDVIRLVPVLDFAIGAVGMRGDLSYGGENAVLKPTLDAFAISFGFSLDYLLKRFVSIGVGLRYVMPVSETQRFPMYLYVGPRVSFRFGG